MTHQSLLIAVYYESPLAVALGIMALIYVIKNAPWYIMYLFRSSN